MGTRTEVSHIKNELLLLINALGWSRNQAARYIYIETTDVDNDVEMSRFEESFKKQVQRDSNPELLQSYYDILLSSPDAQAIDIVRNKYIPLGAMSQSMVKDMVQISGAITRTVSKGD